MTCIIGLVDNGTVYLAADSALCDGYQVRAMANTKLCRFGDLLFGITGTERIRQLIQYHVTPTPQAPDLTDEGYLVSVFVADVRRVLKEHGYSKIDDNEEDMTGGLLVAYRGHLYVVGTHYQVCEMKDGFDAIGAGGEYALGAMQALIDKPPRERLVRSLECAAAMCSNVRAPWVIESLPAEVTP